jgi:hypothetical protein
VEESWGSYMMANKALSHIADGELLRQAKDLRAGTSKHVDVIIDADMNPGRDGRFWDLTGYTLLHTATSFEIAGTISRRSDHSVDYDLAFTYYKFIKPSARYDARVLVWLGNKLMGGNSKDYDIYISWRAKSTYGHGSTPSSGWPWSVWP